MCSAFALVGKLIYLLGKRKKKYSAGSSENDQNAFIISAYLCRVVLYFHGVFCVFLWSLHDGFDGGYREVSVVVAHSDHHSATVLSSGRCDASTTRPHGGADKLYFFQPQNLANLKSHNMLMLTFKLLYYVIINF